MATTPQSTRTAAEVLGRFYAAERIYMASPAESREFGDLESTLAADIQIHQSPDMPYGGEYEGHAGFMKWSEAMATCFDKMEVLDPQILDNGKDVVVTSTLRIRVRKSGEELLEPLIQTIKVDRENMVIKEIRPFYWNVRGLNEALGRGQYGH